MGQSQSRLPSQRYEYRLGVRSLLASVRARPAAALREGQGGLRGLGLAGCRGVPWPRFVWFIDYSLRRRRDADGYLDDLRIVFWCAIGRLVEVWDDDED